MPAKVNLQVAAAVSAVPLITLLAACLRLRLVTEAQAGHQRACDSEAKFLQRAAACDGLGEAPGQFIEFVVHSFLSLWFVVVRLRLRMVTRKLACCPKARCHGY